MGKRTFWLLIISFHALFFLKQIFFGNSLLQDSREYIYAADNIITYKTLYAWNLQDSFDNNWLTKRPFLYPSILAVAKLATFGHEKPFFILVYALQNLASLLSVFLALRIARRFTLRINRFHAFLFVLFSPAQAIYANMVMSEIWLQLCMVTVVYILLLFPRNTRSTFYIALLLIAGLSLKPVLLFTVFLLPLYYLITSYKAIRFKHLALTFLPLLFYFSACKVNERRTGYFHYSSISNINLLHYNTYSMLLNRHGMTKADSIVDAIRAEARLQGDYKEQQQYIRQACTKLVGNDIILYAWLHLRGAALCLLDPGRFDLTQFFGLPHKTNLIYETNKEGGLKRIWQSFMNPLGVVLAVLLLFNLFKIYVIGRFAFSRILTVKTKLTLLFFPLYILFFTGPIGTSRFYMPLIPFVLIMLLLNAKKTPETASDNPAAG